MYKATELYLIQDNSPNNTETWNFLNRRLTEAIQLHDFLTKSDLASQGAKDAATAAFITVSLLFSLKNLVIVLWMFLGQKYTWNKLE